MSIQIGIDSFAAVKLDPQTNQPTDRVEAMSQLLDKIQLADQSGLGVFGIGEHYRREFMDSAPPVILAAAASRTKSIVLTSAVSVLSSSDPVRLFQSFATLDIISRGRAEVIVGRGSFTESFPLFGMRLQDYDELFVEKLGLFLQICEQEEVTWSGKFRPPLHQQEIYPRPMQEPLPVWLGVGGTPASFVRAGTLGLPLMVAVIGGETHRFKPLIDLYREAGRKAGHPPEKLKVGLHSPGYIAETSSQAAEDFYPGYQETFTTIGLERGWPPVTRRQFDALLGPRGSFVVGSPEEAAEKIIRHSEALGGIARFTFQMDIGLLPFDKFCRSIELIGSQVIPLVNQAIRKTA